MTAENGPDVKARSIETNVTTAGSGSNSKVIAIPERAKLHPKTFHLMTTQDQVA